jgi:hypothetical protein
MNFPQTYWGKGNIGDKPITCVVTKWHVTQSPGSGVPALLLKVHLLKPSAKYLIHSDVVITSGEYTRSRLESEIPEKETRTLIIRCNLAKVFKPKMRLKVHLAVQDQFRRKHKLPPIMVRHFQATS